MKKTILTAFAAFLFITVQAQQNPKAQLTSGEKLKELIAETDSKVINSKLKVLLKSDKEEDYMLAYNYYASKEMATPAEETKKTALKKFPVGQFAQQEAMMEIEGIKDLDQKDKLFIEASKKYSSKKYGYLPYNIGQEFARKGNDQKMKFYADIVASNASDSKGNPLRKENIYAAMAAYMTESNPDAAAGYLEYGVTESKKDRDAMLAETAPNANQLERAERNYSSMFYNYLQALANGKNPEKAYQLAKEAYEAVLKNPGKNKETSDLLEESYTYSLLKTNRSKEAFPFLEAAVKKGDSSSKTLANLSTAYAAVFGNNTGYPAYESKILAEQKQAFIEEIEKSAVNTPAPQFDLKDTEGNLVKLSDFKGKVVVVDFWATWCGPCKASFPTMQKAVNQYENDPKVQFLFLHTWENGKADASVNAKKYITDNHYTFKVLMDLRDPKTRESAAAKSYNVEGIPNKFIVDINGNIRFNTSGFSQNMEKAIEELSYMIEYAKKG